MCVWKTSCSVMSMYTSTHTHTPTPTQILEITGQVVGSARVAFLHRCSSSDLDESVKIALDGLLCLSRLSASLRLDSQKRECLASLALATGLIKAVPFHLPNAKHALALKKIISFVETDAEATDEAWAYVLIALSEVERIGLIKSKFHLLKASLAAATGPRHTPIYTHTHTHTA